MHNFFLSSGFIIIQAVAWMTIGSLACQSGSIENPLTLNKPEYVNAVESECVTSFNCPLGTLCIKGHCGEMNLDLEEQNCEWDFVGSNRLELVESSPLPCMLPGDSFSAQWTVKNSG